MTLSQSSEALEFLKRDLTEFSTVVQHDTACSIVATATALRNKLAVGSSLHLVIFDYQTISLVVCFTVICTDSNMTCICTALQVEGSTETTEKVKKSFSSFLGVITDTLAPPPDKTIDCDVITLVATPAGTTEVYDSSKVGISSLKCGL